MKKLLSLILSIGMCLSITACNNESSVDNSVESEISKVTSNTDTSSVSNADSNLYIVPNLIGKTQHQAFEILHEVGLEGQVYFDLDSPDDNPIKSQNIKPGTKLSKDSVVEFYIGEEEDYFSYSGEEKDDSVDYAQTEGVYKFPVEMVLREKGETEIKAKRTWSYGDTIELTNETNDGKQSDSLIYSTETNSNNMITKLYSDRKEFIFEYDSSDRMIKCDKYIDGNLFLSQYYDYSGNTFEITQESHSEYAVSLVIKGNLNSEGYVTSIERIYDSGKTGTYEMEYDTNNKMISYTENGIKTIDFEDIVYDSNGGFLEITFPDNSMNIYYSNDKDGYPVSIETQRYELNIEYTEVSEQGYKAICALIFAETGIQDTQLATFSPSNLFNFFPYRLV